MDKPLKVIVKEKMKKMGIGVPELADATGIPAPRIYKWYSKDRPANPKEADADVLKKWLGESYNSSNEVVAEVEPDTSRDRLEITLMNLSEDKIRTTALLERLVTLLENKINSGEPVKVPEGQNGQGTSRVPVPAPLDLELDKKYPKGKGPKTGS